MRPRLVILSAVLLVGVRPIAAQIVFEPPIIGQPAQHDWFPRTDVADLDGDGDPDVVMALDGDSGTGYAVLLGDGTGHLGPGSFVPTANHATAIALADANEDGRPDLFLCGPEGVLMRLGLGSGAFDAPVVIHPPGTPFVGFFSIAEVTGDGHLDLLLMADTRVELRAGAGDGSFGAAHVVVDLLTQSPLTVRTALLDGDAIPDLVIKGNTIVPPAVTIGVVWCLPGLGGGSYGPGTNYFFGSRLDIELADVTLDGVPDLVAASSADVRVRPGMGDGSFGPPTVLESGTFQSGIAVADFDGDGLIDVAAVNDDTDELVVWRGAETGGLVENLRHTSADKPDWQGAIGEAGMRLLPVADFNLDGRPDLLRTSTDTEFVRLSVFLDHSYSPGAPITDVGGALPDPAQPPSDPQTDTPILLADGTLAAGSLLRIRLFRHAAQAKQAWFVLGASELAAPFLGGTMVPHPDCLVGPFTLGPPPTDKMDVTAPMPALPSGSELWLQAWFIPSSGQDPAASSAVRLTAP
jgi:hypothetical protein